MKKLLLSLMISLPVYAVIEPPYCENKCPSEKPIRMFNCECVDCNYAGEITHPYNWSEEYVSDHYMELKKCSNREEKGASILKECPKDLPLKTQSGCKTCDDIDGYTTERTDCDKCPNRSYKNGSCFLTKCPDSYVREKDFGKCVSCESANCSFPISEEECEKCPDLRYEEGRCVNKNTKAIDCLIGA